MTPKKESIGEDECFRNQLAVTLDDDNIDFFIHIDKKTKAVPVDEIKNCCKYSNVYFIEPIKVNWGGFSQIECTLRLLENALEGEYNYYHYISGVDFPIKTKQQILAYFEEYAGMQFVHFEQDEVQEKYVDRLRYHSLFQDCIFKKLQFADKAIRWMERRLKYSRLKEERVNF